MKKTIPKFSLTWQLIHTFTQRLKRTFRFNSTVNSVIDILFFLHKKYGSFEQFYKLSKKKQPIKL